MKLCKDCKHCFHGFEELRYARCELTAKTNLVTGKIETISCATERDFGNCGKEGKNFEPLEV